MSQLSDSKLIIMVQRGFFYNVSGNDALILHKYFNYKLNNNNGYFTGFPIKSLNEVLSKLDDLSINYRVYNQRKEIIAEKIFENNRYKIEHHTSNDMNLSGNEGKKGFTVNHKTEKRLNKYIGVLTNLKQQSDFYSKNFVLGLSNETKETLNEILLFLKAKFNMYEEKPWTEKEKRELISEYKSGLDREQIAINHQRNIKDINSCIMDFMLDYESLTEIIPKKPPEEQQRPAKKQIQKQPEKNNEPKNDKKRELVAFEPPKSDFSGKNTTKRKSCKECLSYRKEECFGKSKICGDFRYAPLMDDEKRRNWPKYGDATFYRMTNRKKK